MFGFGNRRRTREAIDVLRRQVEDLNAQAERVRLDIVAMSERLETQARQGDRTAAALFERIEALRRKV